ncbi:hypothetical protein N8569_00930 [bacterium]|nr:hypothetical protein [bacterium]
MPNDETFDVLCQFMTRPSLKDEFNRGCEKRGLNASALYRKAQEEYVNRFRQEDAQEPAA